jgi:hypothetical protein
MSRGKLTRLFSVVVLIASCSDDTKQVTPDSRLPDKSSVEAPKPGEVGTKEQGGGQPYDFVGIVEGFGANGANVPSVLVELYDNDTGKGTGKTQTADANGKVTFAGLEKGKSYGFKMTLKDYKDAFVWNKKAEPIPGTCKADADCGQKKCDVPKGACVEKLWAVPNSIYNIALATAGLTAQPGKSVAAGAVYWVASSGTEEAIGCAKVTSTPATKDVRYMKVDTGLPAPLADQPCTANNGTKGNGRFVAANIDPGQVTLSAVDSTGKAIGSVKFWSVADSIAIGNLYAESTITSNPTPATCACTP